MLYALTIASYQSTLLSIYMRCSFTFHNPFISYYTDVDISRIFIKILHMFNIFALCN